MSLLKIKLKKAYESVKRDGFLTTAGRVGEAVYKSLVPVGSGETLIITGGIGDSARYRAYHQSEYLNLNGVKTKVTTQDNPRLVSCVSKFNNFVFHRVLVDKRVARMIELIKKQQKKIIFDIDDLVYDPQYLRYMDYYKKMSETEKQLYKNGVGGEILNDHYVKNCTVATEYLATKLRELGKNVQVIKNKLSIADQLHAESILINYKGVDDFVRLGYFSGTRSHDKDFETITQPLIKILTDFKNVQLIIAGPLNLDTQLKPYQNQIIRLPFVSRKKHFENILSIDINLIPLEIGNPFCEAKSEIKFVEAGILAKPSVASSTQTFKDVVENNVDGLVAHNDTEWYEALAKLITDPALRRRIGLKAQAKVNLSYINKRE